MRNIIVSIILISEAITSTSAWTTPQPKTSTESFQASQQQLLQQYDKSSSINRLGDNILQQESSSANIVIRPEDIFLASSTLPIMFTPEVASAATAFTNNAVPSALAAYGHYLALIGILGCIMVERLTIKPNMTSEEEDLIAGADIGLGIFGALIAYTGYLRAAQYEKGFDFYSHEPLFWLKIAFVGVFGAASFFNTIIIIKRSVSKRNGELEPMGEKLANRMKQICNAEITAIGISELKCSMV